MEHIEKSGIEWYLAEPLPVDILDIGPLPGRRRQYWVREYGGGKAFIKLFNEEGPIGALRNRFFSRGKREYEISLRLQCLSLPSPRVLGYGIGSTCSASIQEWMEGVDFLTAFQGSSDRIALLSELSSLLLSLKRARVRHNDLHTRNILVSEKGSCLIDLHKTHIKGTFRQVDELANMCHALSSIYPEMGEEERKAFFDSYGNPAIRGPAEAGLTRLRANWVKSKKKRAFRSTSILAAHGGEVRVKAAADAAKGALVGNLKEDRKTRVDRFADHVRKTYRNRRRLTRAWENHVTLEYMGLRIVPKPFFVRKVRLTSRGFVAMEDLGARGEELSRFVDRNYERMKGREMGALVGSFSAFLLSILRRGIAHRDLKTSNVFVLGDGSFRLLDVEDVLFETPVNKERLATMLVQLNKSLPGRVAASYRLRLLAGVAKGLSLTRDERKALLRSVREESLRDAIAYTGVSGFVIESWTSEGTG